MRNCKIMLKKYSETIFLGGIFPGAIFLVGLFPGGNFLGGISPGGFFLGGIFPDIHDIPEDNLEKVVIDICHDSDVEIEPKDSEGCH